MFLLIEIDFTSLDSQVFVISPETMTFPITIQTANDSTLESDESFFVSFNIIEDNNGLILGSRTSALVTINDNDGKILQCFVVCLHDMYDYISYVYNFSGFLYRI